MAVVPRLDRIQQAPTNAPNTRLNVQYKDRGNQILNQANDIAEVGVLAENVYNVTEDQKADQLADVAEQAYSAWNSQELQKLKQYQGDPTDAYAEYDKRVAQKREDLLNDRPDLSERVRTRLTNRMDKTVQSHGIAADMQRGAQQETYENNVFESTVKMRKDTLPQVAGYVKAGDQDSFKPFQDSLDDIRTTIAKRGIKQGTVTVLPDDAKTYSHSYIDDDGKMIKVQESPIAKGRIAKEQSEGIKDSIKVLISGGQIAEAKEMQEKYKGYIDPVSNAKINEKFNTAGRKSEAFNLMNTFRSLPAEDQINKIDAIKDLELRSEVLKYKQADERRIASLREMKGKANYETLASKVIEKMNSDQPYNGIADLEDDPDYKETWDNIPAGKKKAIVEMIEAPKASNDKSLLRVQNLILGTDGESVEGMSPEAWAEATTGLSAKDKAKYTTKYMSLREQSSGETRATYNMANKMLQDQLISDGHIKRSYGKIQGEDEQILIKAQQGLLAHLDGQGNLKPAEMQKFVKDYSVSVIKNKVFNPEPRVLFKPSGQPATTKSAGKIITIPPGPTLLNLKKAYKDKYGSFPKEDQQWQNFLISNKQG